MSCNCGNCEGHAACDVSVCLLVCHGCRPVKLLRFFAATFCQVLDIAVLNLFLIALDCNYFDKVCGASTNWIAVTCPAGGHACEHFSSQLTS
jgi:hypothetical protein